MMVRAALTQTRNAYPDMPTDVAGLASLATKLEDIRAANVAHHVQLMAEAHRQGVQLICFGELFTGPYFALRHDAFWTGMAESATDGPTVRELQEAIRSYPMIVVAPLYELDPTTGKRYNTAVVIDEQARILGRFRKVHIPHGTNEQGSFLEGLYYERSNGVPDQGAANLSDDPLFPVFQTSVGRLGVAICYDRHFTGSMACLAQGGAQLVVSPAVTFGAKSHRMWHMEFAVDAVRHHLFIGGSNRIGAEAPWGQPYFGDSHFVGPNGVLANASDHPELIISDIDLGELERPDPAGWNLVRDRRHRVVMG